MAVDASPDAAALADVMPPSSDGERRPNGRGVTDPTSSANARNLMALIAILVEQEVQDDAERLIAFGCHHFGLEVGVFLRRDEDGERIDVVSGDAATSPADLGDALFKASRSSSDRFVTAIDRAGKTDGLWKTFRRETGFETVLATAVHDTERCFGTLCFAGREPRLRPFDDREKLVLRFLARWLAMRLAADEAKRSHEAVDRRLRKSEERYRILYEKTPAMLHSIDDRGRLTSVSDTWLATLGYARDDVIGRRSTDFLTSESKRYAEEVALPAYRAVGHCDDIAYQFVTKNGDVRDIWLSAISQTDEDGNFSESLAVLLDVTERQRIERSLARKTAALERSNADLARFAQVASHDLQEPLRRIIAYCDLLKEDHGAELSEEAATIADIIRSGGRHLRLMINDLLAYVRVGEGMESDVAPVDMTAILHQALDDLHDDIAAGGVRVDAAHLPLVWGRASLLRTLFHHLLRNAIDHGGGRSPRIDVSVEDEGERWRFAVTDGGIGVEPRFAERIFEIFQRLHPKDERESSGAGLAICRLIVQRSGGDIWLDPSYRDGARFLFTLPKDKPGFPASTARVTPPSMGAIDPITG